MAVLVVLLGFSGEASAQVVPVRSGEHEDFTRIVADFPAGTQYVLERDGDRLTVKASAGPTYALDDVFRRINRRRVAAVSSDGEGQLIIDLACRCRVESVQQSRGWVILDIFDPDAVTEPPEIQKSGFPSLEAMLAQPRDTGSAQNMLPGLLTRTTAPDPQDHLLRERADDARAKLVEQFARAAAQGIVRANELPTDETDPPSVSDAVKTNEPVPPLAGTGFPNLRVQTQIDRDAPVGNPAPVTSAACLPRDVLDFASWVNETRPQDAIRRARLALYDEMGNPDPEAYRDYVRALIFATFFEEALSAIRNGPENIPGRDVLRAIAITLDDPFESSAFASQIDCEGNGALLALIGENGSMMRDPNAALRHLRDVPDPLRSYLAPMIAERFLDFGQREEAELVRNGYERESSALTSETKFVAARLEESDAEKDDALVSVVADRAPRAAEAMNFLLTSQMSRGDVPDIELIEQALALTFELVDPDRAELERTILESFIAGGRYGHAFEELDRIRGAGRGPFEDIEATLYETIADIEDDAMFLKAAVPIANRPIANDDVRLKISGRLFDQGLRNQAERIIDSSGNIPIRGERLLRARIAADAGKADIARSYLAGLEGEDVAVIRSALDRPEPVEVPVLEDIADPPAPERFELRSASETLSRSASLREQLESALDE